MVPHERTDLPDAVCKKCVPDWTTVNALGMNYCEIWMKVVRAVADSDFAEARRHKLEMQPITSELDALIDQILAAERETG